MENCDGARGSKYAADKCDRSRSDEKYAIPHTAYGYYSCREERAHIRSYCTHSTDAPCIFFLLSPPLWVTANSHANGERSNLKHAKRSFGKQPEHCSPTCSLSWENI